MADLLPTLPSDDEQALAPLDESDDDDEGDEVDKSFQFGGILVSDYGFALWFCLSRSWDDDMLVIVP